MELLKEWKGKIKETFKDVVGELDPAEKRLADLVERATHESLPGPDLALNLALADEINTNPRCTGSSFGSGEGTGIVLLTAAGRRRGTKPA